MKIFQILWNILKVKKNLLDPFLWLCMAFCIWQDEQLLPTVPLYKWIFFCLLIQCLNGWYHFHFVYALFLGIYAQYKSKKIYGEHTRALIHNKYFCFEPCSCLKKQNVLGLSHSYSQYNQMCRMLFHLPPCQQCFHSISNTYHQHSPDYI